MTDTDFIDYELPPSKARDSAGRLAEKIHTKLHPWEEPENCECLYAWRRHPSFGGVLKWYRDRSRKAAKRLEGLGD